MTEEPKDDTEVTETFVQYTRRLAREAGLRRKELREQSQQREAKRIAELREQAQQRKAKRVEDRKTRKAKKSQLHPELTALVDVVKAKAAEVVKDVEMRKASKVCVCCRDDKDIKVNGYCQECWAELSRGVIQPDCGPSDRQCKSAMCRVIRKGSEMS